MCDQSVCPIIPVYFQGFALALALLCGATLKAQNELFICNKRHRTQKRQLLSMLKSKGIIGKLAKSIITDTSQPNSDLQRIDIIYQAYKGRIIQEH